MELEGKRAWVTGAAQGIGRAIAARLAAGGARVALTDVNDAGVTAAAAEIGGDAYGVRVDVTDADAVQASLAEAAARFGGGLDIVVNNAGIEIGKPLVEHETDEVRRLLDINIVGVFHGIKYAVPHLGPGGVIVNMASVAGLGGSPLLGIYCASKGAVIRMSEVAAIELKALGIRVVTICPAFVDTPMVDRLSPGFEAVAGAPFEVLAQMKQTRIGTVEDIAEGVAFVASDESSWLTGQPLVLDGGMTGSLL